MLKRASIVATLILPKFPSLAVKFQSKQILLEVWVWCELLLPKLSVKQHCRCPPLLLRVATSEIGAATWTYLNPAFLHFVFPSSSLLHHHTLLPPFSAPLCCALLCCALPCTSLPCSLPPHLVSQDACHRRGPQRHDGTHRRA